MAAPVQEAGKQQGLFYFDVVSPFAYLLHATLSGVNAPIPLTPKPVLFAGILHAFGQKGPAEIPSKRIYTYEYCVWLAQQRRIPFQMPASHPFNPMRYLRLIVACDCEPRVITAVFDALFATGRDPEDPATWSDLVAALELDDADRLIADPAVKQKLRTNTDEAIAAGVFGVPTIAVDDRLFWGLDSLPMLAAYLAGDQFFASPAMQSVKHIRVGAVRQQ